MIWKGKSALNILIRLPFPSIEKAFYSTKKQPPIIPNAFNSILKLFLSSFKYLVSRESFAERFMISCDFFSDPLFIQNREIYKMQEKYLTQDIMFLFKK